TCTAMPQSPLPRSWRRASRRLSSSSRGSPEGAPYIEELMTQHIGIVACSAEGAALCYRTVCIEGAQYLGRHAHPEVTMHTPSLAATMERIYRGDWAAVGEIMLDGANKLAKAGA